MAVGKATQNALQKCQIPVDFTPSKATAATMAQELPPSSKDVTKVLYPASAKAKPTLQQNLEGRTDASFSVTRLDTYDTIAAQWTTDQQQLADQVDILCVASPSALNGWLSNNNNSNSQHDVPLAACIGETSAQACREAGCWTNDEIWYPADNPGMDGWMTAIQSAIQQCSKNMGKVTTAGPPSKGCLLYTSPSPRD